MTLKKIVGRVHHKKNGRTLITKKDIASAEKKH